MSAHRVFHKTVAVLATATSIVCTAGMLSDLHGEYRNGQVFLQWKEKDLPTDARLSVWTSERPLSLQELSEKHPVAKYLNPGSARDWWLDIDSFLVPRKDELKKEEIFAGDVSKEKEHPAKKQGFVIQNNGQPIAVEGGLHVHTVSETENGKARYYAVTWQHGLKGMPEEIVNLPEPIAVKSDPIQPIALARNCPGQGSAKGKPLVLHLHGRGGGAGVTKDGKPFGNFIVYSDSSFAWREGIPFKFSLWIDGQAVHLTPSDRVWIGRPLTKKESQDARDYVPAISTFWFGYNPNIAVSNLGPEYVCDNFTERYLLFLVRWAQQHLGTDPHRTYSTGGSMGGTGSVQLALHYPDVFAAVIAYVPIYSYTWRSSGHAALSVSRLRCFTGPFTKDDTPKLPDGRDLLEHLCGEKIIANPAIDFPPIFATNGRQDTSIPWANNPPFYKAALQARQAFHVFWNNGDHGMSGQRPKDCQPPLAFLFDYATNRPFLALSNNSDNKNPGNGDAKDGDMTGWFNRGFHALQIQESETGISAVVKYEHPDVKYPVTADLTFRRRQTFRPAPGTELAVTVNDKESTLKMPADGLLTIPVRFEDASAITVAVSQK
ncbi:MAG: prolyl oligopeptidase family serine peptidase [Victivallales bacterium]|nr:prolyl oligopeptidase family serine peptidase [Victivallales bacterium]